MAIHLCMAQPAHKDIGWELYRSYLGVVQEGSLSGAARALGVTQPTVGRHIAALEQALGLVLFTRSQQGLLPTASEVIGVEVLPPILAQLQAEHPALTVELVLSNRVQDLLQHEADIAIRMTEPRQDALIARRVGSIPLGLHAHPR